MMKRNILLLSFLLSIQVSATVPHKVVIPDVPGYVTLKGDFHVHTVVSDGRTWPSESVDEAEYDCLDFVSITDHLDTGHLNLQEIWGARVDRNSGYEIAAKQGKKNGVLVIHGAELSRGLHILPGHFGTQFISDAAPIAEAAEKHDGKYKDKQTEEENAILDGLREARAQNSFTIWNHPDWKSQAPNETLWWPIHTKLYDEGLIQGIEIVNRLTGYCPEAFHWAVEKNLAIVSGTDAHEPMYQLVDYEKGDFRPMTLVFAKERSVAGIREALESHRTAVFCDGSVYGSEENIKPLLEACIEITSIKFSEKMVTVRYRNNSSIPIVLTKAPGSENVAYSRLIHVNAGEQASLGFYCLDRNKPFDLEEFDVNFFVENWLTDADTPLRVSYHIVVPEQYRAKY